MLDLAPHRRVAACLALLLSTLAAPAATPQEEAFLRAWGAHARDPLDHAGVLAACQGVMDKSSTLGDLLPAVKTLAAWHLLASGKEADAARVFESALTADRAAAPVARFADTLARRWLTRIDQTRVEQALKRYHAEHVEFPASLAPLLNLPKDQAPPKTDRFGDPWVYKTESFSKLKGLANQRYSLYSKTLGSKLSRFDAVPFSAYGRKSATLVGRKSLQPLIVEFETVTEAGAQRGVAAESGLVNGLRFLRLASDARFALLVDGECDFWVVAAPARSQP